MKSSSSNAASGSSPPFPFRMLKYRNSCLLNNMGVELLERGFFQEAHDTLHTALAVFYQAFQEDDDRQDAMEECCSLFEQARRKAAALYDIRQGQRPRSTGADGSGGDVVQIFCENATRLPSSIFMVDPTSTTFTFSPPSLHAFLICNLQDDDDDVEGSASSTKQNEFNVDFHCATIIYNFALSKLSLYQVLPDNADGNKEQKQCWLLSSCHLLQMAFTQLGRIISHHTTHHENHGNDEDDDAAAAAMRFMNLTALSALVLGNLVRVLLSLQAHEQAHEMWQRLLMIQANLSAAPLPQPAAASLGPGFEFLSGNDNDNQDDDDMVLLDEEDLFAPTAAPAA